jgi:small RNA 2'-O-methyltransferase
MTSWLHEQRLEAVAEAIRQNGARSVVDLGCGDGDLLVRLMAEPHIEGIAGIDLCPQSLRRLRARIAGIEGHALAAVEIVQGSLMDHGNALRGFDCAIMIETIEHIDPELLSAVEKAVFREIRPATIIITTPNAEFNSLLGVPGCRFRHPDHRFEWNRAQFGRWTRGAAARNGFRVACSNIAGNHPTLGGASQMAVFTDATELARVAPLKAIQFAAAGSPSKRASGS